MFGIGELVAGEDGAGCCFCVDRVAFADVAAEFAVRARIFHDRDGAGAEMPGEAGAVGGSAFDADGDGRSVAEEIHMCSSRYPSVVVSNWRLSMRIRVSVMTAV